MSNMTWKLCAAGCCVVYLLAVLFLPFATIKMTGIALSGVDMLSYSAWPFLAIVAGMAMGVCAVLLPGIIGAAISLVGAFFPMFSFLLTRNGLASTGAGAISSLGLSGIAQLGGALAGSWIQVGFGVVLAILFGLGSAVLCFLSERGRKPKSQSAGLTVNDGDEW